MRVCHVIPYVSEEGAYGGPVAVAVEQTQGLAAAGYDVTLVAGWDGRARLTVPGVKVELRRAFRVAPTKHLSALFSPGVSSFVKRQADIDIFHFHAPRDLTVNLAIAAARNLRGAALVQTHGMIPPARNAATRIFDLLATSRSLRSVSGQIRLTREEPSLAVAGVMTAESRDFIVPNGVSRQPLRATYSTPPNILFCSRLHPRKRVDVFIEAARVLRRQNLNATFSIVGPDDGSLHEVTKRITEWNLSDYIQYEGPLAHGAVLERLAAAQCFVLPSVNEPFPMAVLEALSVGVPTVITDSTGISGELRANGGAIVTDGSVESISEAIAEVAKLDAAEWKSLSQEAVAAADRYSVDSTVQRLVNAYQETLAQAAP